jgi:leader peptidase (prepilin peptidase)/N-methyltransferase
VTDETFVVAVAGVLGAMVGSFLNVCILRWPRDQSVVRPRSRCPGCDAPIAWYDNIPVLSWLLLRGRCRRCGLPISLQYPLVELGTALIWAYMAARYAPEIRALSGAVFFTMLLGIAMTDARDYLIPDQFSLGGLGLGLLFSLPGGFDGIAAALAGAATGFAVLWAVGAIGTRLFKEDAMGGGDIKMMAMVGAFVGWQGVLLTIFLGAVIGTVIGVPLSVLLRHRLQRSESGKVHLPFGVFLAIGAAISFLAGPAVIAWYRDFVLHP